MLFPFYRVYEFLNFCNLRVEHLLEELRGEFLGDGEFIGSLHGLVEVAAKPAEVLLELQIEVYHFVQGIDLTDCCRVIKLRAAFLLNRASSSGESLIQSRFVFFSIGLLSFYNVTELRGDIIPSFTEVGK